MLGLNRPQPQEDDQSTTSMPLLPVDPDHTADSDGEQAEWRYPQWHFDEDGWPIIPSTEYSPPIWKA